MMRCDKCCTTISPVRLRQRCPATTSPPMMCRTASASHTGHGTDSRSNTPPPQLRTLVLTIAAEHPASRRHKSFPPGVYIDYKWMVGQQKTENLARNFRLAPGAGSKYLLSDRTQSY